MEDKERTLYCGNLSEKVTEDLLYELFLQAGPLENVVIPKEKDGRQRNYGFITFKHAVSVPYSIALMSGTSLFGKQLKLDPRGNSDEPNPYLEKLRQYQNPTRHHDDRGYDNRSRRGHESRRFDPRMDGEPGRYDPMNASPSGNPAVFYPGYNQQYLPPPNFQQMPGRPDLLPSRYGSHPQYYSGYR